MLSLNVAEIIESQLDWLTQWSGIYMLHAGVLDLLSGSTQ